MVFKPPPDIITRILGYYFILIEIGIVNYCEEIYSGIADCLERE